MRTKGLLYTITFFGYANSLSARAARRLLPRAPGARFSQLKVTKARTNGRPKRTGAHLRAMEATRPAGDRRGAPGSVLRLDLPTPRFLRKKCANMPTSTQKVERHSFRFPGPFAH